MRRAISANTGASTTSATAAVTTSKLRSSAASMSSRPRSRWSSWPRSSPSSPSSSSASSPGPVFYRQTRIGLRGRTFEFLKFRSMTAGNDAGEHRDYVCRLIETGAAAPTRSSSARTSTGAPSTSSPRTSGSRPSGASCASTRSTSCRSSGTSSRGDMSMVGPRPALEYEVAAYKPWHRRRLEVAPGVSGLWQVAGRSRVGFDEMVFQDVIYALQPVGAHRRQSLPAHHPRHARRPGRRVTRERTARDATARHDPRSDASGSPRSTSPSSATATGVPTSCATTWSCPTRTSIWVCDTRPEALKKAQARYPAVAATTDLEVVLGDASVDAVLIATPISTHHPIAKAALEARQARLRREADDRRHGAGARAGRAGRGPRPHAHGRPHLRLQPAGAQGQADHRERRAGRHLLRHHPAREPGAAPEGRERDLGPGPARPQHPPLLARRGAGVGRASPGAAASSRASPTWRSSACASPAASSPRCR